jgi:hypothetical protein
MAHRLHKPPIGKCSEMPPGQPGKHHPVVAVMKLRGETFPQVAAAIGITPEALRMACCGHARTWPKLRVQLADHFGLPEDELFDIELQVSRQ